MLRHDYSQSVMAERIGLPTKTFSGFIRKLRIENADNELGILLKEHAERKMKKIDLNFKAKDRIHNMLNQYEKKFPIGEMRYESKDYLKSRYDNLYAMLMTVERLLAEGATLTELGEKKIISESNYRKYKTEVKYMGIILSRRNKNINNPEEDLKKKNNNESR